MGPTSPNNSSNSISSSWGAKDHNQPKNEKGQFGQNSVAEVQVSPHYRQSQAKNNKVLTQRQVSSSQPDQSLQKKALKNFNKALKEVIKEGSKKGATIDSMKATLNKHASDINEVADIFYKMPARLLNKKAVGQAFGQILAEMKPDGELSKALSSHHLSDQQIAKLENITSGKTGSPITPHDASPDAFTVELNEQKKDGANRSKNTYDIDQVINYMMQLKKHGAPIELLNGLAQSFPDYKLAGWTTDQFLELCYEAQLAIYEKRANDTASAIEEAHKRMR